ncbi:angiopoietin-related protein 1b [Sinocyclocheilus anshuiensis]|uniref:angiopoietin-related protein 1b n=1 Tax=Sinocyclocheilus anshuiensis TaxID=1608454 RepID=UPI0007B7A8F2|nr:PREDICTED: angiopoietin-related protein 1-like [Sinocyclocheilus anshuiensis]
MKDLPVPVLIGRDWPGVDCLLATAMQPASPGRGRRRRRPTTGHRQRPVLLASDSGREVPQASTGFTPFEVLFGRQPRDHLDMAKEAWEQQPAAHRSVIEHVKQMRERIDRLEGRILNSTAEALRLSALYRELEVRFSSLAALVNNQSLLIAALEERCLQVYWNHRREPLPPPLVQVVPENIPVYVPRFSNEIQRSQGWPVPEDRSPRTAPATTGGLLDLQHPPQGNVSLEGPFRDCLQAMQAGHSTSGTYLLKPDGTETPVQAWCEHDVDRGGWTLIQRRKDGSVNFFRNWDSYKKGFGDVDGEHWLGLENIYNLGKQEDYKLLVELEDWMGKKVYAAYSSFHLEPESQAYRLCLGTYQGNAGDSLSSHNGKQFTTLDHDNDAFSGNCAHFHKAGWWYSACGQANLNGVWYSGGVYRSRFQDGVFWADYGGGFYSMKSVRMMIRPID